MVSFETKLRLLVEPGASPDCFILCVGIINQPSAYLTCIAAELRPLIKRVKRGYEHMASQGADVSSEQLCSVVSPAWSLAHPAAKIIDARIFLLYHLQ